MRFFNIERTLRHKYKEQSPVDVLINSQEPLTGSMILTCLGPKVRKKFSDDITDNKPIDMDDKEKAEYASVLKDIIQEDLSAHPEKYDILFERVRKDGMMRPFEAEVKRGTIFMGLDGGERLEKWAQIFLEGVARAKKGEEYVMNEIAPDGDRLSHSRIKFSLSNKGAATERHDTKSISKDNDPGLD